MKHAISVMLLAGMAGGALWYKSDPKSPPTSSARLQIPDPGPDPEAAQIGTNSAWEPLDIELLTPVDKLPPDQIAEKPSGIQPVSDEQAFAVSEDESDESSAAATQKSSSRDDAAETPSRRSDPRTGRDVVDQSVEGRPISVRRLGQGRYRTVIVTGMDGRDRTAVQWADDLADALEERTELLQQQEFVIIRAANPDGLAAKTRANARGVDLNRNFPTRRFQTGDTPVAGAGPASEPETRALLQTLYELRPQRVLHLCSTSGASGVYINQPAGDVAERLQRQYGLPTERLNYDQLPGSVEEFAEATWNSSVILLQLRGVPDDEIERKVMPVLISAVSSRDMTSSRRGAVAPISTPRTQTSRWPTGPKSSPVPQTPSYQQRHNPRPILRRGYEELPPPPQ